MSIVVSIQFPFPTPFDVLEFFERWPPFGGGALAARAETAASSKTSPMNTPGL